jgi:hypothetical protein
MREQDEASRHPLQALPAILALADVIWVKPGRAVEGKRRKATHPEHVMAMPWKKLLSVSLPSEPTHLQDRLAKLRREGCVGKRAKRS